MKDSYLGLLPIEIVLNCLTHLDIKSILRINQSCNEMNKIGQEKSLWLNLCFLVPKAKALIEAANIEVELKQGIISPYRFLTSILKSNITDLKSLLFQKPSRIFSLWLPCYEVKRPSFFACTPCDKPRNLYLTEELAKKGTLNASRVKQWLTTKVSIDVIDFEQLFLNNSLSHMKQVDFESPAVQGKRI